MLDDNVSLEDLIYSNEKWLMSKERQSIICKMQLLGVLNNYDWSEETGCLYRYYGNLEHCKIPDIFLYTNKGQILNKDATIKSVEFGEHFRILGPYAFDGAELQKVVLNDGLVYIAKYALAGNNLSELVIPSKVKYLGRGCLEGAIQDGGIVYVESKKLDLIDILIAIDDYNINALEPIVIKFRKRRKWLIDWERQRILTHDISDIWSKKTISKLHPRKIMSGINIDWF